MFYLLYCFFLRNFTPENKNKHDTSKRAAMRNTLNNRQLPPPNRVRNFLRNNHLQGISHTLLHLAFASCGRVFLYLLFLVTFFCCKDDEVHFVQISEFYAESCHLDEVTQDSIVRFSQKVEDFVARNPLAKEDPLYPRILHNIQTSSFVGASH